MVRAIRTNDTTQLAFCSRLGRLSICSLHLESCSCGVTEKPPELLDEETGARALYLSPATWLPARFDHESTRLRLPGRSQHRDANCTIRTLY